MTSSRAAGRSSGGLGGQAQHVRARRRARQPPGSTTPRSSQTGRSACSTTARRPRVHGQSRGDRAQPRPPGRDRDAARRSSPIRAAVGRQPGQHPGAAQRRLVRRAGARSRTSPSSARAGSSLFDAALPGPRPSPIAPALSNGPVPGASARVCHPAGARAWGPCMPAGTAPRWCACMAGARRAHAAAMRR